MNPLADELNSVLDGTIAGRLLSNLGRRFYFPKGIIAQSQEAKNSALFANGTIGMAYRDGKPLILSAIADSMSTLSPEEAVAYAPTAGVERARQIWKDLIIRKNPSLDPERISMPVVVPGLTAGLSYTADMFISKGSAILTSDPCWDNYPLIFETRRGAELRGVPFFGHDFGAPAAPSPGTSGKAKPWTGLDMELIGGTVREAAETGTVRFILNFPNNPSGYSPTRDEEEAFVSLIRETAEGGADVLVICDDAYFGLFYEENISKESLFVRFADLHERVLAVKVDGPIKEDYVWGLRMGFLTFGSRGLRTEHYEALIKKLMGAIRSSVSCANTPAQHLMLKAMEDKRTEGEKRNYRQLMQARYEKVKNFVSARQDHPALRPLPFNSGYFMCFRCIGVDPETLRQELLKHHGIGTISLGEHYLRIAFSGIDEEKIPQVYQTIYDTASKLREADF
ncbi:MAG: aminotransferase class I/II-fold pyridoxal phosphate-dependent enzyme [Treponema sp.]|jgi:aspartate/methionine/tyrosine aminotransferase|nr:aminotransferase class I/II-fold pyridoxal phosphate-dependent enzyme [Treponema sp.]